MYNLIVRIVLNTFIKNHLQSMTPWSLESMDIIKMMFPLLRWSARPCCSRFQLLCFSFFAFSFVFKDWRAIALRSSAIEEYPISSPWETLHLFLDYTLAHYPFALWHAIHILVSSDQIIFFQDCAGSFRCLEV